MKIIPDTTSPSVALAVTIILAVLASGCMGNPEVGVRRVQKDVYLISSDRCAVLGDELERDILYRATLQCRHGVAEMGEFRSRPSRQGSLLGECLRSGALEAQVTCHGGRNKAE